MLFEIPPPPKLDISPGLLVSPEFKEDSVREEIIFPILKALGYSALGNNRIVRSRSLDHNFIRVGSKDRPVKVIPDYLLEIDDKVAFVIDAKAPSEDIMAGGNVEQAYSYAIHREIRTEKFALCNGKLLTVFSIYNHNPIKVFDLINIAEEWEEIYKSLSPLALTDPDILDYAPDFGTALLNLGFSPANRLHMFGLPVDFIAKVDDKKFTTMKIAKIEAVEYAASYDFSRKILDTILAQLPKLQAQKISKSLKRQPYKVSFESGMFFLDVEVSISPKLEKSRDGREEFHPLIIKSAKTTYDSTGFKAGMIARGRKSNWEDSDW